MSHVCISITEMVPVLTMSSFYSASPLNGQAAELCEHDPSEFKRLVLARHQDLDEE